MFLVKKAKILSFLKNKGFYFSEIEKEKEQEIIKENEDNYYFHNIDFFDRTHYQKRPFFLYFFFFC